MRLLSLVVEDLHFTYPGWPPTLSGASLAIEPGKLGFLLGPSGSGKSTLLRCIAGLEMRYEGTIKLDDRALGRLAPHKRNIGMLFQEPALFPHLNVWENVAFGLTYRGLERAFHREQARQWLRVVGLPEKEDARVDQLSGGQRQRVSLARTLAARPRAVLLDEPLTGLDRDLRDALGPRVKELLADQGVPALWVTHDRDEAARLGDVVWELVDGRCVVRDEPS